MSSNQANNKRIARNSVLLTFRMLIVMGIGLYSTRVILNVLGASDYGIYNVVGGFVSMFAFLNTSMSNGIQRFYNYELGKNKGASLSHVYNTAIRIQLVLVLIVLVLTETVGLWYLYDKMVIPEGRFNAAFWCFHFSVMSLMLTVLQLPFAALVIAHEKMDFYAVISIIDAVLKLAIAIALPYMGGDKLIVYGIMLMLISFINIGLYYVYVRSKFPDDIKMGKGDESLYKGMLSFTGWNFFGSFGGVLRDQGLNMLLNLFFGTIVNAARGIAHQVMGACKSFVVNITTASRPQLTKSYAEGNIDRSIHIMYSMSKLCFISLFFFALPIMIEIDFILQIWLGDGIPENTALFVILVLGEALIDVLNPPVSFMVHATGKMRKYQIINTSVSLFSLPVAYLLLKMGMAAYWVFIVAIVFSFLRQLTSIITLRKLVTFSIRSYLTQVVIPMLAMVLLSIIIPFFIHGIMEIGWIRLLTVGSISVICVGLTAMFVGLNNSERMLIKQFVVRKKNG